jgi:hypothetical protein
VSHEIPIIHKALRKTQSLRCDIGLMRHGHILHAGFNWPDAGRVPEGAPTRRKADRLRLWRFPWLFLPAQAFPLAKRAFYFVSFRVSLASNRDIRKSELPSPQIIESAPFAGYLRLC